MQITQVSLLLLFSEIVNLPGVFLKAPSYVADTLEARLATSQHVTQVCSSRNKTSMTITNLHGLYFEVVLVWRATRQAIALRKSGSKHRQGETYVFVLFPPLVNTRAPYLCLIRAARSLSCSCRTWPPSLPFGPQT